MMDEFIGNNKRALIAALILACLLAIGVLLFAARDFANVEGPERLLESMLVFQGMGFVAAAILAGLTYVVFEARTGVMFAIAATCAGYILYLSIWG